jgi:serine/threonine protein kinase
MRRYDPLPLATLSLSRLIQYSELCLKSNLPVVLLSMAGDRLDVSTAIFTDAVYADKLLSVDLRLGTRCNENVLRVARIFTAINNCTERLRGRYKNLWRLPKMVSSVMYPSPTADPPNSTIPPLEFFAKLNRVDGTPLTEFNETNRRHGIYLARMRDAASTDDASTKVVLVKFTEQYNDVAHRLLASHDPPLAPTLYHCVRVIGGLHMVVMEYMPNAKMLPLCFPQNHVSPLPDAKAVERDLNKALSLLHEKNLVFGDLRPQNILYSLEGNRTFLVDFDWVGKHEEDRYPPCLNTNLDLGVRKWQIMEQSHDFENLHRTMEWLAKELHPEFQH